MSNEPGYKLLYDLKHLVDRGLKGKNILLGLSKAIDEFEADIDFEDYQKWYHETHNNNDWPTGIW